MKASLPERTGFVFSAMVLALLYGFVANKQEWFPNPTLERAWQQAEAWHTSRSPWHGFSGLQTHSTTGERIVKSEKIQPGLTLITSFWDDEAGGHSGLRLIDTQGETVHAWKIDRASLFPDSADLYDVPEMRAIHGTYLFPNGDMMANIEYVGTVRLDACGQVLWHLSAGNHHSIARADDGTFWIPGTVPKTSSMNDEDLFLNQIMHVTADGKVLDQINVMNLLRMNDLERHIYRSYQSMPLNDVTHLNDVEPLDASMADEYPLFEAGDLLISLRDVNLVLVFDPEHNHVKWHASAPFVRQHDPDFIGNGWIGIFNNNIDFTQRGNTLGGSQIVAFQPHTDSTAVLFPTKHSDSFYTDVRGKWQELANGNMLLTEARAGRVLEVTPDGRTAWEWIKKPYRASQGIAVTEATRYDLTREDVSAWECSSANSTRTPQ